MSDGYNGYDNYETWVVGSYFQNTHLAGRFEDMNLKRHELAQEMKEEVRQRMPKDLGIPFKDLLEVSIDEVNWQEIAEGYV